MRKFFSSFSFDYLKGRVSPPFNLLVKGNDVMVILFGGINASIKLSPLLLSFMREDNVPKGERPLLFVDLNEFNVGNAGGEDLVFFHVVM
jgi:hypothetical protein